MHVVRYYFSTPFTQLLWVVILPSSQNVPGQTIQPYPNVHCLSDNHGWPLMWAA